MVTHYNNKGQVVLTELLFEYSLLSMIMDKLCRGNVWLIFLTRFATYCITMPSILNWKLQVKSHIQYENRYHNIFSPYFYIHAIYCVLICRMAQRLCGKRQQMSVKKSLKPQHSLRPSVLSNATFRKERRLCFSWPCVKTTRPQTICPQTQYQDERLSRPPWQ